MKKKVWMDAGEYISRLEEMEMEMERQVFSVRYSDPRGVEEEDREHQVQCRGCGTWVDRVPAGRKYCDEGCKKGKKANT